MSVLEGSSILITRAFGKALIRHGLDASPVPDGFVDGPDSETVI